MWVERCRASAVIESLVVEDSRIDPRMGSTAVGRPLNRLKRPYLYQSPNPVKVKMWKRRRLMANGIDRRMTKPSRDDEQARRQLA